MHATLLFDGALGEVDQLANVLRGGAAEVHNDVRVNVRDLRTTVAISFQPTLIHEPTRTDALDLLEDRACAWMPVEPRVFSSAPTQILLENAVECRPVASLEPEGRGQHDVSRMMKHGIIVAELHIVRTHHL